MTDQTQRKLNADDLCVARVPLFAGLRSNELYEIANHAKPLRVKAGETIHKPGDKLSHLLVVHKGRVRISFVDEKGNERLVRVLEENDFVGEASFITGAPPDHVATALDDVELCTFDHKELQALVTRYPGIAVQMLKIVSERLNSAEQFIAELTTTPVQARLARYLLDLPAKWVAEEAIIELPFAKKDVASILGMAPETLSRQLASLSRSGAVSVNGNSVTVVDPHKLITVASK